MLNPSLVLNHIKRQLGYPVMKIEYSDEQILELVREESIREWSYYIPNKAKVSLNLELEANKVPGRGNEFYINEPEGREILNVVELYFDQSNLYIHGHPPMGVFNEFELRDFALQTHQAMTTKMFSPFDITFEFSHPNIIRISPMPINHERVCTVEYERMSEEDFSEIPNDVHRLFLDLATADVMIVIGRLRKKYGSGLRSPFGEIPLESEIHEEGKELKREVIEKLERLYLPNIIIDNG